MRIPFLMATGSLTLAFVVAGTSSAQMYEGGYWDGYRNGTSNSAYRSGGPYAPQASYARTYPDRQPYDYRDTYPDYRFSSEGIQGPPPAPTRSNVPMFSPTSKPMTSQEPGVSSPFADPGGGVPAKGSPDYLDTMFDVGGSCAVPQTKCVQWMVAADALYMTRVQGNSYALLKVPSPTPPPPGTYEDVALDVSDFDFNFEPGWRITASRMVCDGWGIEAGYFALDGWEYRNSLHGILELQGPGWSFGSDPDAAPPTESWFRVYNKSDLLSGELNLTHGICDWATLRIGLRYIEFNDRLEVDELFVPAYNLLVTTTDNNLFGPQVGADLKLFEWGGCCQDTCGDACSSEVGLTNACGLRGVLGRGGGCRFRINATFNLGVMYNHVEEDPWSDIIGPPLTSTADELALLGEASLTAKFRLTDHVAIRGGYQFLALHNVALAPDQIASADVVTETSSVTMGSLISHGGTFGIEVFW